MAGGINLGDAWINVVPSFKGMGRSIAAEVSGIEKQVNSAATGWGSSISSTLGGAFKAVSVLAATGLAAATGFIASYAGEAMAASDATAKFKSTLDFAGLDSSAIQALTKSTQEYADKTVYDLADIQNITAQLASNGVQGYDRLAEAAGNLNAVAGGNKETFRSVGQVITQTAGAGKLMTENWRQLTDAIPGAAGPLKQALADAGAYTGDFQKAMEQGQISAEEFNAAITSLGFEDAAAQAATSTATFEGAWGNFEAAITGGLVKIIEPLKGPALEAFNGFTDKVASFFESVSGKVSAFTSGGGLSTIGAAFAGLAPVVGGLSGLLGPLMSQIPMVGGAFSGLTGPVGLVAGLLVGVVQNSAAMQGALGTVIQVIGDVAATLAPILGQAMGIIGQLMGQLGDQLAPIISQLATVIGGVVVQVLPMLMPIITQISGVIGSLIPIIGQIMQIIADQLVALIPQLVPIFQQVTATIGEVIAAIAPLIVQLSTALIPVVQSLMPIVQAVFSTISNVISAAMDVIRGVIKVVTGVIAGDWGQAWEGVKQVFSGVWDGIKALLSGALDIVKTTISAYLQFLASFWGSVWNGVVSTVSSAWNGIVSAVSNGISNMMSYVSGIPGKIMGFFAGAGSWLVSSGRSIIQGLIDGISNMVGNVKNAVSNVLQAARNLLPFSPAKEGPFSGHGWTLYSGQSIVEALADGVTQRQSLFKDAVAETMGLGQSQIGNLKGGGISTYANINHSGLSAAGLAGTSLYLMVEDREFAAYIQEKQDVALAGASRSRARELVGMI